MIITQKTFPNYRKFEMMYEGRPLSFEVGKMAELCNASVLVKYGETSVLVTCTASARPKDGIDYFPLAVSASQFLFGFYIDGEYAMSGVDQTDIQSGKAYAFRAEKA